MANAFGYEFEDGTDVRIKGFLDFPGWETSAAGHLRDAIWSKSTATFQRYIGSTGSEHLSLWRKGDGKYLEPLASLEAFKVDKVREVSVTPFTAEKWDVAFVDRIPRDLGSTQPKALVELWDNFNFRGSDCKPSSHLKVPEWKVFFTQSFPVPDKHGMYIRNCYADLYDSVMTSFEKGEGESEMRFVHVNGTPGIGKSMFMWYIVLREASKQSRDIFLRRHGFPKTLVFPRQGKAYCVAATDLRAPEDGNVLYLINQRYEAALGHYKYNVIFASPDETNYKEATKVGKFCTKYMPSWDKDRDGFWTLCKEELGVGYKESDMSDAVASWGFVPRYVLDM